MTFLYHYNIYFLYNLIFIRFTCPEKTVLFNSSFYADSRRKNGFQPNESLCFCVGQQKKRTNKKRTDILEHVNRLIVSFNPFISLQITRKLALAAVAFAGFAFILSIFGMNFTVCGANFSILEMICTLLGVDCTKYMSDFVRTKIQVVVIAGSWILSAIVTGSAVSYFAIVVKKNSKAFVFNSNVKYT